jgi:acylphosphatase
MNKCLKIVLEIKIEEGLLQDFIQKNAKKFNIEGIVQAIDQNTIRIIACGSNDNVDKFMDLIYAGYKKQIPTIIEVEPFLKDKDYRGVFRLIE